MSAPEDTSISLPMERYVGPGGHIAPASWYLGLIDQALRLLIEAARHAYNDIPAKMRENYEFAQLKGHYETAWTEEDAPEVRRFYHVLEMAEAVRELLSTLEREGMPEEMKQELLRLTPHRRTA